ncbi:MAG: DUF819 family protein, partial [Candidatus Omnitrophica bacterium]|nr:DUF819 family protein [Candidatus Omnitrophota bacterium]
MIKDPVVMVGILIALEALVLWAASSKRFEQYFDFLPSVFWIYFLPMLAATLGLIDPKAPVLGLITTNLLPIALILLLVVVDVRAILRLGGKAIGLFFIGSAGVMIGAALSFVIFKRWIGTEFWAGFGALSASWTGGSANMIAVKEAVSVPDNVFLPMVVVDTVIPYVWMGVLIAAVRLQPAFDRWNHSDRRILEELKSRSVVDDHSGPGKARPYAMMGMLCGAIILSILAQWAAGKLPVVKDMLSPYAWTIIVASALALGLSFTPARKVSAYGSTKTGYYILYFVLTAIGAKAAISSVGAAAVLIGAGFLIVLIHALFLLAGARLLRAPLFLVAAASQANIGGVASAPVVAAVYEPGLASVGLLLAILGNIVGTYLGILCAQMCRIF